MNTPKPDTRRARALDIIAHHPRGIRSAELAAQLGVPTKQVHAAVAPLIDDGQVVSCKVTTEAGETVEFRAAEGAGMAAPRRDKRAFTIKRRPAGQPIVPRAPETFEDAEAMRERAAALRQDAPTPASPARTAATPTSSAIVIEGMSLDQDGALALRLDDGAELRLAPEGVLALGDFLHATEGVWRA